MENNQQYYLGESSYTSEKKELSLLARYLPSLHFYLRFGAIVWRCSGIAQQGEFDDQRWGRSSLEIVRYLEDIGVQVSVAGMEHVRQLESPCVFIGNHMSFLETVMLPSMILPHPLTYVVKQSLIDYPVFKHILRSKKPIVVTRVNPRQDLKTVLAEGVKRLEQGVSVVVFPQATRSHQFEPDQMGSIGVKLAKKASVPIIPLAIKTDALQNGKILKDFGRLDCSIPVCFSFGSPLTVEGKGTAEQEAVVDFIQEKISGWEQSVKKG